MSDSDQNSGDTGKEQEVVSVRGSQDGLVFRIDGKSSWDSILENLEELLSTRQKFFSGGNVALEWLERLPTKEQSLELEELLTSKYRISVVRPKPKISITECVKPIRPTISSFAEARENQVEKKQLANSGFATETNDKSIDEFSIDEDGNAPGGSLYSQMSKVLGDDLFYEDDANARVVYGTLRSGQRIETPFSLVIIGDVNPGADVIAGGDIYILGSLRGTAHAAAYEEYSEDRVIMANLMQPVQLRIGSVISRGGDEPGNVPEIARLESRRIIVESYDPRSFFWRRR